MLKTPILVIDSFLGIQNSVNPHRLKDYELKRAENVNFDAKLGSLTKDTGYTIVGSNIGASTIIGMGAYYANDGTTRHRLVAHGTKIYYLDGSTWTDTGSSTNSGAKGEFANLINKTFYANFLNATQSYNGSAWSASSDVTGAPKAKYITSYNSSGIDTRLYLFNVEISGTKYPFDFVRSSSAISGSLTWNTATTGGDRFQVPPGKYGGTGITGWAINGPYLLIFTDTAVFRHNGQTLKYISNIGAINHRCIQTIGGYTYYTNPDGAYRISPETMSERISDPIQNYWDAIPDGTADYARSGIVDETKYRVYLGSLVSTEHDIALPYAYGEFDTESQTWRIGTTTERIVGFFNYVSGNKRETSFGDDAGNVYLLDTTNTQNGNSFPSHWSKEFQYFDSINTRRRFYVEDVVIEGENLSACNLFYQVFSNKIEDVKQIQTDGNNYIVAPIGADCRAIAFSGGDNGSTEPYRIDKITVYGKDNGEY